MKHEFVEDIPEELEEDVLYISIPHATAIHKCACRCGEETVTPFSPTDWKLTFNGQSVSLSPSIGNWSLKCKSHYWIRNGRIEWAGKWSPEMIETGRRDDLVEKRGYYKDTKIAVPDAPSDEHSGAEATIGIFSRGWSRLMRWLGR